jgi:hypothetical protein
VSDCFLLAANDPYQPYQDSDGLIEVPTSTQFVAGIAAQAAAVTPPATTHGERIHPPPEEWLCLRILQSALVYVNTLMLEDILDEPEWAHLLTPADRRGLTLLFWSHLRPYGEVNLNMAVRLDLTATPVPGPRTTGDEEPAEERTDA